MCNECNQSRERNDSLASAESGPARHRKWTLPLTVALALAGLSGCTNYYTKQPGWAAGTKQPGWAAGSRTAEHMTSGRESSAAPRANATARYSDEQHLSHGLPFATDEARPGGAGTVSSATRSTEWPSEFETTTFSPSLGGSNGSREPHASRINFGDSLRSDARASEATLIGLYGESGGAPRPGAGHFDGAANLIQVTTATEGASFDPDIDRTGRRLAFASTQHRRTADIYVKSTEGRTLTQITSDPADDVMPTFAPDGRRVAFASNRSGNWDIFYTNIDGDPPIQLTFDNDDELHPTWSPDGEMIAYCKLGSQSGRWEIWVVNADQTSAPRFLEYGIFPHWNPDPAQNRIVFQRARERGSRLFGVWTIDYVNGEARHPTEIVSAANAAAMHPAWSPDGSRIVFVTVVDPDHQHTDRPSQSDVWVVNADGQGRTSLTNGQFLNLYPVWSADGTVYFLSDRSGVDNIWAVTASRRLQGPEDTGLVNVDPMTDRLDEHH